MKYMIRIVRLSEDGEIFEEIVKDKGSNFTHKFKGDPTKYEVRKEGLYKEKIVGGNLPIIRNIGYEKYRILFWKDDPNFIRPYRPSISPTELYIVSHSTALREGINEKFRQMMNMRVIGFLFLAVLALVIGLYYMGYI